MLAGVSAITSLLNNKPFLIAWSTKENYKYLIENWDVNKSYTEQEKNELLIKAKNAYLEKSDEAKDIGKIVHKLIENHIKGKEPLVIPEEAKNSYNSFLDFEKSHNVIWLLTEEIVCSKKHSFCGTLDGLAVIDGVLTLVDHKTSNQVDEIYYLQTGAYQLALMEQMPTVVPQQRIILKIPKNGDKVEPIIVPTDIEFDMETFLHLRECRKWLTNIESNHSYKNENGFNKLIYKKL